MQYRVPPETQDPIILIPMFCKAMTKMERRWYRHHLAWGPIQDRVPQLQAWKAATHQCFIPSRPIPCATNINRRLYGIKDMRMQTQSVRPGRSFAKPIATHWQRKVPGFVFGFNHPSGRK
jgi:hypothetical protein